MYKRQVHALVGFVDDQYIPVQLGQVAQLVVLAAEILGAFHVLQADELDSLIQFLAPVSYTHLLHTRHPVGFILFLILLRLHGYRKRKTQQSCGFCAVTAA